MATAGAIGHTTTLNWNVTDIAEVTSIGGVSTTVTEVDSTSLGSANHYKEILPGLLKADPVDIEGIFDPSDTNGQVALLTDMNSRTSRAFTITFPTAMAATWTGTAYVLKFATGPITSEGMIPFAASLGIVGKPTLNITLSAGMTVMTGIEENAGAALVIEPSVAVGTYSYTANAINTASTWVKLTITAGDSQVITVTALGVDHTLLTTVQSGAITISAADSLTPLYIKTQKAGEVARNYTLWISRP